jgi:hypothetical protein
MRKVKAVAAVAVLAVLMTTPAVSCMFQPERRWLAIDLALPKTNLSDADRAKVAELRAKAYGLLAQARRDGKLVDAAKFREAERATEEARKIVGLVDSTKGLRSCG